MKIFRKLGNAVCIILLGANLTVAQRSKSVLLPATQAKALTKQCSRPAPSNFDATWQPKKSDIRLMESRFSAIKQLEVKECCLVGYKIENPERYYMQYVGIKVNGRKLIYISAFAAIDGPPSGWRKQPRIVCDGGVDWGVLYDAKSGEFFDLAVNGVG